LSTVEKKLKILVVAVIVLILVKCDKDKQDNYFNKDCLAMELAGIYDDYDYSQVINADDWKYLSWEDRASRCNIPEDTLKYMCTHGLVKTYFNHPLLPGYFAFNNIKEGYNQFKREFNGMRELIDRPDGSIKIFEKYLRMAPSDYDTSWSDLEKGTFSVEFTFVEITLAYNDFLNNFSNKQKKNVLHEALQTLQQKEMHPNMFCDPSLITCIYLIANILENLEYEPFLEYLSHKQNIKNFINGYLNDLQSKTEGKEIIDYANEYLNPLKKQ